MNGNNNWPLSGEGLAANCGSNRPLLIQPFTQVARRRPVSSETVAQRSVGGERSLSADLSSRISPPCFPPRNWNTESEVCRAGPHTSRPLGSQWPLSIEQSTAQTNRHTDKVCLTEQRSSPAEASCRPRHVRQAQLELNGPCRGRSSFQDNHFPPSFSASLSSSDVEATRTLEF